MMALPLCDNYIRYIALLFHYFPYRYHVSVRHGFDEIDTRGEMGEVDWGLYGCTVCVRL